MLAEWRGLPQNQPRPDRARPAGDVLAEVMKKLGLGDRLNEAQVLGAWREVVGDFLAAHSSPSHIVHGVLHVHVVQSTVFYEMDRVLKPEILKKLKLRFGAKQIRDVKFRVA